MEDSTLPLVMIFVIIIGLFVYFLPSIIARNKRDALSIFLLNFFLGATGVGWVIALVWACKKDEKPTIIYVNNEQEKPIEAVQKDVPIIDARDESTQIEVVGNKKETKPMLVIFITFFATISIFLAYMFFKKVSDVNAVSVLALDTTSTTNNVENREKKNVDFKPKYNVSTILSISNPKQLYSYYGNENVKKEKLYDAENNDLGSKYVLFPNTSKEIEVDFYNGTPSIVITKKSNIELPYGLYVGMPLNKLLNINGEHVSFTGFEWDYDGYVSSFNGGVLENKGIKLKLSPSNNYDSEAYINFLGDKVYTTSQTGVELLKLKIIEIIIEKI